MKHLDVLNAKRKQLLADLELEKQNLYFAEERVDEALEDLSAVEHAICELEYEINQIEGEITELTLAEMRR